MEKPTWLDECFVQKVLQKAEKDESIEVSDIIVKPATAKGDNYASDIHRITVELSRTSNGCKITKTRSLLAKVALQDDVFGDLVFKSRVWETEISAMVETLPKMDEMLAELSRTSLAARCLEFKLENPWYLIIEDLAPRGFRMAERRGGLDLEHSLLAIRNIAVFHAASVALAEKDPRVKKYVDWSKKDLEHMEELLAARTVFVCKSTNALGEEVANWAELSPRISEKILKLSETIEDKEREANVFLQDDFNVLNHGDCTLSNMLFRYDERQKPIEQTFVDFQCSQYGSPAYDILTFIGTSPAVDIRMDNRDLLLHAYHDSLTSTMTELKCSTKAPSFDNLQDILKKRAFAEVIFSITGLPHVLVDRSEAKRFEELLTSDGQTDYYSLYRGKMYRKTMTRVLPFFDSMGLLDV